MARTPFRLEHLDKLDNGTLAEVFDQAVRECNRDCQDRPGSDKPRTVILKFHFRPHSRDDRTRGADLTSLEWELATAIPRQRSKRYALQPHHDNAVSFNPDSPDDPNRPTLFEEQEPERDGLPPG